MSLPTTLLKKHWLELELPILCFQTNMEIKTFFLSLFLLYTMQKRKVVSAQFFECKVYKHFSSGNDPFCRFQANCCNLPADLNKTTKYQDLCPIPDLNDSPLDNSR